MEGKWSFLAKSGICKEQKMQGKINLNQQGKESARNGIWREMESEICNELNLPGMEFARNGICKYRLHLMLMHAHVQIILAPF